MITNTIDDLEHDGEGLFALIRLEETLMALQPKVDLMNTAVCSGHVSVPEIQVATHLVDTVKQCHVECTDLQEQLIVLNEADDVDTDTVMALRAKAELALKTAENLEAQIDAFHNKLPKSGPHTFAYRGPESRTVH